MLGMGLFWWLSWVPLTRVLVTLLFTTPHRILRQHTLLEILRRRYAAGDAEEYLGRKKQLDSLRGSSSESPTGQGGAANRCPSGHLGTGFDPDAALTAQVGAAAQHERAFPVLNAVEVAGCGLIADLLAQQLEGLFRIGLDRRVAPLRIGGADLGRVLALLDWRGDGHQTSFLRYVQI
jgi:hypothetical protein